MDANMGNFKGVMLCNRPSQIQGSLQSRVLPSSTMAGNTNEKPAFISSVVPDKQLGLNPVKGTRSARVVPKSKSDDVTWRHKKWLAEFQERRNELVDSMEQQADEVEYSRQKFMDRSAKVRAQIRRVKEEEPTNKAAMEAAWKGEDAGQYLASANPVLEEKMQERDVMDDLDAQLAAMDDVPSQSGRKKKVVAKPRWALSDQGNEQLDADLENQEVEDLLDFANGLDYDTYIDDMEVREAMRFIQERVKHLDPSAADRVGFTDGKFEDEDYSYEEVEVEVPDTDEGAAPGATRFVKRIRRRRKVAPRPAQTFADALPDWDGSTGAAPSAAVRSEDAAARAVLDSSRGIRSVHSTASVKAMIAQTGGAAAAPETRYQPRFAPVSEAAESDNYGPRPEPRVAVTKPHTMKEGNPSNLPFLFRHPGI